MKARPLILRAAVTPFLFATTAVAQTQADEVPAATQVEDEVIAYGKIIKGQHDGIDAFLNGDYETAEIEFELELKSLRRGKSALENFAFSSDVGADISSATNDASSNLGSAQGRNGAGAGAVTNIQTGNYSDYGNQRGRPRDGRTVLTDGRVTDTDFAVASYMAGLSEIKLGKFDEAEDSLKRALRYDPKNTDARMRLGMLHIREGDIDKAADQLELIDRRRKICVRSSCDELAQINDSASGLSGQLLKAVRER